MYHNLESRRETQRKCTWNYICERVPRSTTETKRSANYEVRKYNKQLSPVDYSMIAFKLPSVESRPEVNAPVALLGYLERARRANKVASLALGMDNTFLKRWQTSYLKDDQFNEWRVFVSFGNGLQYYLSVLSTQSPKWTDHWRDWK